MRSGRAADEGALAQDAADPAHVAVVLALGRLDLTKHGARDSKQNTIEYA